jgi:hypothetical protein
VITDVCETVATDPEPVPVTPIALEVELRGYGWVEELDGAPDENPDEYGEVPTDVSDVRVPKFDELDPASVDELVVW